MTANLRSRARALPRSVWQGVARGSDAAPTCAAPRVPARRPARGRAHARAPAQPLRVLDVGCGEAQLTRRGRARAGLAVVGIDVAEEPLRRARERDAGLDLRLVPLDGDWPLQDASFDAVWAGETIEHVLDTAGLAFAGAPRAALGRQPAAEHARARTPDAARARAFGARASTEHFDPRSRSPALLHAPHARAAARRLRLRAHRRARSRRTARARAGSCWPRRCARASERRRPAGARRGVSARRSRPGVWPLVAVRGARALCVPAARAARARLGLRRALRCAADRAQAST